MLKKRRHIQSLVSLIFLAVITYYIANNFQQFTQVSLVNPYLLLVVFIAVLIRNFSTGLIMDTVLKSLGIKLAITESFGLANLTRLVNQVTPGNVGIVMRSVYLKKKYKLSYAEFVSSFAASQIVLFLVSSVLGLYAIYELNLLGIRVDKIFIYILLCSVIFFGLILSFPDRFRNRIKHNRLSKALNSWHKIRKDIPNVIGLIIWSLLFMSASTLIMFSTFNSLGAEINVWIALFFSSINIINSVVAITPSGFGVSEAIVVILAKSVGIPVPVALSAAILQRAITFLAMVLVTPYFSRKLFGMSIWRIIKGDQIKL